MISIFLVNLYETTFTLLMVHLEVGNSKMLVRILYFYCYRHSNFRLYACFISIARFPCICLDLSRLFPKIRLFLLRSFIFHF